MNKGILLVAAFILVSSFALCWAGPDARSLPGETDGLFNLRLASGVIPDNGAIMDVQDLGDAVNAGANYLKGMQADITDDNAGNGTNGVDEDPDDPDDGGWDWVVAAPLFHHTTAASPTNLYGVTANGLYRAYLQNADPTYFTAMKDAADHAVAVGPGSIRSASDLVFLMKYDDLPEVPGTTYMDAARAKYDGRIAYYGSAQALAEYIRDIRNGQGYPCGLIAWDIGVFVVAAQMFEERYPGNNYGSDADAMAEVIYQDSFNDNPGYFDIIDDQGWDPGYGNPNYWMYTLGITGLLDAFVAANVHTAEIPGLLDILAACRYSSGAYSYCYGANSGDEDWQSTAYSVMSLARIDLPTYQSSITETALWLASTQDASGGFVYSNGDHYPEIGGECTAAMSYGQDATDVPTLSEWGMLIMGLLLLTVGTVAVVRKKKVMQSRVV